MNWKKSFVTAMAALSLSGFLIAPQILTAAGRNGSSHSENIIDHSNNGIATVHGSSGAGIVNNQGPDIHAAMVHVAEAESHLAQVRQRGNAHEILRARGSLHESERYYIGLLATSSGVSVTVIEELHGSGVSLAQIGFDLQMVRYPSSKLYVNGHDLEMSGLTMDVDHSVHTDTVHGTVSDHHGVIENSNRSIGHGTIVSPTPYSRKTYPNNYNNQKAYDYHSSGGGMGGMH